MYGASQGRLITAWIDDLAPTIGRLRRRTDGTAQQAADEIANQIENLDAATYPDAATLYKTFTNNGDNDDTAITTALHIVDTRATRLRNAMGLNER